MSLPAVTQTGLEFTTPDTYIFVTRSDTLPFGQKTIVNADGLILTVNNGGDAIIKDADTNTLTCGTIVTSVTTSGSNLSASVTGNNLNIVLAESIYAASIKPSETQLLDDAIVSGITTGTNYLQGGATVVNASTFSLPANQKYEAMFSAAQFDSSIEGAFTIEMAFWNSSLDEQLGPLTKIVGLGGNFTPSSPGACAQAIFETGATPMDVVLKVLSIVGPDSSEYSMSGFTMSIKAL